MPNERGLVFVHDRTVIGGGWRRGIACDADCNPAAAESVTGRAAGASASWIDSRVGAADRPGAVPTASKPRRRDQNNVCREFACGGSPYVVEQTGSGRPTFPQLPLRTGLLNEGRGKAFKTAGRKAHGDRANPAREGIHSDRRGQPWGAARGGLWHYREPPGPFRLFALATPGKNRSKTLLARSAAAIAGGPVSTIQIWAPRGPRARRVPVTDPPGGRI